MGGLSLSDMYSVNAAGHANQAGPSQTPAPDAQQVGAASGTTATGPAFSWITLVATLVAIRVLWEYSE